MKKLLIGLIALTAACQDVAQLETDARAYGKRMGYQVVGVECMNMDSDQDGYVSCSMSVKKTDGNIDLIPVECASQFWFGSGCRRQKLSGLFR